MAKRGRTSLAELTSRPLADVIASVPRPDAPYDLTDEQAEEWRAVVDRLPADWFPRETWAMLAQYCRHVVSARRVGQLIESELQQKNLDLPQYDKLLAMQEREGRALSSLGTRMRLTQQATFDKERKKDRKVSKPWEA
jgi:hypothetical protein